MPVALPAASHRPTSARGKSRRGRSRCREQEVRNGPRGGHQGHPRAHGNRLAETCWGHWSRTRPADEAEAPQNDAHRRNQDAADRIDVGGRRERKAPLARRGVVAKPVGHPSVRALVNGEREHHDQEVERQQANEQW